MSPRDEAGEAQGSVDEPGVDTDDAGNGDGLPRPRPFWSGVVAFGLVSIPVDLYPGVRSSGVSLRMLAPDGTPLERRYQCPEDGEDLSSDEIVRGWEMDDGTVVVVSDEELEALEPKKSREIDLTRFVPVEQLDPVYFQRAYFLTPSEGATKAYRLLADVMERTGQAGIATFVMRGKEYLVAILAEGGILRAETLRFAGEVRTPDDVGLPDKARPEADRVRRMRKAIGALTQEALDEEELEDGYAARLLALVEAKRESGEDVVEPEGVSEAGVSGPATTVIDLMEVLKASLTAGERRPAGRARPRKAAGAPGEGQGAEGAQGDDLEGRTRDELYLRARALDIPGRSSMSKAELIRAIRKAS